MSLLVFIKNKKIFPALITNTGEAGGTAGIFTSLWGKQRCSTKNYRANSNTEDCNTFFFNSLGDSGTQSFRFL